VERGLGVRTISPDARHPIPDTPDATVLVISDDADIGGLVALYLRECGLRVEHTDPALALAFRWAPACGRPDLVVVTIGKPTLVTPSRLSRIATRTWAVDVPLIVAADALETLTADLQPKPALLLTQPTDAEAIARAAMTVIDAGASD
jgi:DNA-binding NtrC family response regulator